MISNSRKEIDCKVQQEFNIAVARFRTKTLKKLSIIVIVKDKSTIRTHSEDDQCQFAKPDAGEGIHDRHNPSSDHSKFIWKYLLMYHIYHVCSSL